MPERAAVACARLRIPLLWLAIALIAAGVLLDSSPVVWTGAALLAIAMLVYLRLGIVRREQVEVRAPVAGRWLALNSPANRVPSHGLNAYGQTYAIDLVHVPEDGKRPGFGAWPLARRPEEFPAFGQPVYAPVGGVVTRAHDRERDHWSRTSWLALPWLLPEGAVRELLGPGRILGNHVIIDTGKGVYAVLAHLRRGSVRVRPGERVAAGEQVAECGNSGNSTEPHLHFQLMDHRSVLFAAGLPFRFERFTTAAGGRQAGVPRHGQPFEVEAPRAAA